MKPKTKKQETQPIQRHYYKMPVDSKAGKLLTRFWHACQKCEEAAEDYCKKFGAKYYYSDPNYFTGGVACVAFDDDTEVDKKMWKPVGEIDGDTYYLPACEAVKEMVEIPHRDYALHDSWDTMYLLDKISMTPDKKVMVPKISFRPRGEQRDAQGRVVQASRKMRRAIIAEQKRLKLPVMTMQQIYGIFGAQLPQGKLTDQTPTFFVRSTTYYIGCAYTCTAEGLEEITQQQYRMNQCLAEREIAKTN